jgi:trimethyllysine dioxygenase
MLSRARQFGRSAAAASGTARRAAATLTSCSAEATHVQLEWDDGREGRFHYRWLRDHCPSGFDPVTLQRKLATARIDRAIRPAAVVVDTSDAGDPCALQVEIEWEPQGRRSVFPSETLHARCGPVRRAAGDWHLWDAAFRHTTVDYAAAMATEATMDKALRALHRTGIVFVTGTPGELESTEAFARRIGFVRQTMYGLMWSTSADDSTVENPATRDSAYSTEGLVLHTDCAYLHDPPGLQIFNCVAQADTGGSSLFLDGFKAAAVLRDKFPRSFAFLTSTPLRYQSVDGDTHAVASGPVIELDAAGAVSGIRHNDWSATLEQHTLTFDKRLPPGTMVLLNNRRVLHGRRAFTGKRRLTGCYLGRDEFESRLRRSKIIE